MPLWPTYNFLDLSYTPIAQPVKLLLDQPGEVHISLNKVAALADHDFRHEVLKTNAPARFEPEFPNLYPPDEQLMCFDLLYWGATMVPHEWQRRSAATTIAQTAVFTFHYSKLESRVEDW